MEPAPPDPVMAREMSQAGAEIIYFAAASDTAYGAGILILLAVYFVQSYAQSLAKSCKHAVQV